MIILRLHARYPDKRNALNAARFAPQGAHYHAILIGLLYKLGINKGARSVWYQLGAQQTFFITQQIAHSCIKYQVCDVRGRSDYRTISGRQRQLNTVNYQNRHIFDGIYIEFNGTDLRFPQELQ